MPINEKRFNQIKEDIKNDPAGAIITSVGIITICTVVTGVSLHNFIKESKETKSIVYVNNGIVSVYDYNSSEIDFDNVEGNYSIIPFNDQNWIIFVKCDNSAEYAEFIANNIYFGEDNKVLLNTLDLTDANYEYFVEHIDESAYRGVTRVNKG